MGDAVPAVLAPSGLSPEDGSQAKPPATIAGHTPLPWHVSYGYGFVGGKLEKAPDKYIAGGSAENVGIKLRTPWVETAWEGDEEAAANVEFIVLACNAHYDLLTDLDWYADQLCEGWCERSPDCAHFEDCGGCRARRAAFKARGEK